MSQGSGIWKSGVRESGVYTGRREGRREGSVGRLEGGVGSEGRGVGYSML